MAGERRYRLVVADGVVAVVVKGRKILLLKRFGFPNPRNPGIWTFISGGRDRMPHYVDVAYKEIEEESGIAREQLKPIGRGFRVCMFERRKKTRWYNQMFIFSTDAERVKLNFENTAYRWATIEELRKEVGYTNIFINESAILERIRSCLYGSKKP
jgi:8-oxo-dGTP pyrophosphatase MutT (NUDIX family)